MRKPIFAGIVSVIAIVTLIGCASVNRTIFGTQKVTVDAGVGALKGWKAYYKNATNGVTDANVLAELAHENEAVYAASRKLGATEQTISALRLEMAAIVKTNGNPATVLQAIDLTAQAVTDNNANVVALYQLYTSSKGPAFTLPPK